MQLVAYGAQDIYLTGNPQITFFKVVYRRHTNFSMEAIEQTWNGTEASVSSAGRCTSTISRNGDLVYRMYLEINGTHSGDNDVNVIASSITDVELEIGGQRIDKHTGAWMNVWSHLTEKNPSGHTGEQTDATTATGTNYQNMSGMGGARVNTTVGYRYFTPLQFWFCRNPGLALPLIALQYHEVKVILNHDFSPHFQTSISNQLWCDYIYLDTDERRRFAQVSHEYLIEQVQEQTLDTLGAAGTLNNTLNFNHPVKELIWAVSSGSGVTTVGTGPLTYQLKLNGHDRFAARDFRYFTRVQVWEHHSGVPGLAPVETAGAGRIADAIGVYSFALKPEEHQPSGTCNFSRIDNAEFVAEVGTASGGDGTSAADVMYAVNYNVLRIMSGMGGLAYSN